MKDKGKRKDRKFPRVSAKNIVSICLLDSGRKVEAVTSSREIGLGGLMFESDKMYPAGQKLGISLLAHNELISIDVRTVWCRKDKQDTWQIGVEFQNVPDETQTKLLDYLMYHVYVQEEK